MVSMKNPGHRFFSDGLVRWCLHSLKCSRLHNLQVTGVIARRGYNIQSLAVGTSETEGLSRITIVIPGTPSMIQKLTRHILKLISVSKVRRLTTVTGILSGEVPVRGCLAQLASTTPLLKSSAATGLNDLVAHACNVNPPGSPTAGWAWRACMRRHCTSASSFPV